MDSVYFGRIKRASPLQETAPDDFDLRLEDETLFDYRFRIDSAEKK